MRTDLFIIIVTYNGIKWISKCLKSCAPYSVIVVDNNSSDGTVSFIKKNFKEATIFEQSDNLGFGAANNIGISYAIMKGADYVFLLNQDAYLEDNTIEDLLNVHRKNTDFGILSPIHLNRTGSKLDMNFSKYIKENKKLQYDALKHKFTKDIYEMPFLNAAAWLLSRKTIEIVGGFDPIFFHLGEDVNYCQRVLYHNLKVGVVPNVYVMHDREFRPRRILQCKKEKIEHFERGLKQSWANINVEIEKDTKRIKSGIIKIIIKLILKLKFDDANLYLKKYILINSLLPEINKSREVNKKTGLHYLDK